MSSARLRLALGLAFTVVAIATSAQTLTDPTRPPHGAFVGGTAGEGGTAPAALELQAVFFAEGRRVAIVNGQRVGVHDVVGDAEILSIDRQQVEVRRAGKRLSLTLIDERVKRPHDAPTPALPAAPRTAPPRSPRLLEGAQ